MKRKMKIALAGVTLVGALAASAAPASARLAGDWNGDGAVVVGDWNGDGIDTPGYRRTGSTWVVRTEFVTGGPIATFVFGAPQSVPFTW